MPTIGTPNITSSSDYSNQQTQITGLTRSSISPRRAVTAYDTEHGPFQSQTDAYPCSGSSSTQFTRGELAPFRALETKYANLFSSNSIIELEDADSINLNGVPFSAQKTRDVDLDECLAINLSRDGFDSIGTLGLASCIGIAVRGKTPQGETIIALNHYSGFNDSPAEALEQTLQAAIHKGATLNTIQT